MFEEGLSIYGIYPFLNVSVERVQGIEIERGKDDSLDALFRYLATLPLSEFFPLYTFFPYRMRNLRHSVFGVGL